MPRWPSRRWMETVLGKKLILLSMLSSLAVPAQAQLSNIELDGSLPNGLTTDLTPEGSGPDFTIDSTLGEARGANLFHSFLTFSIGPDESATFTDSTATAFQNVIARVTGGHSSAINGTLRSTIPGADFYLLNPSGVLFGGTSAIDLPASFYVSTAHTLGFEGGETLDLVKKDAPVLSAAAPEAFGFLSEGPGDGEIKFSNPAAEVVVKEFAVRDGETLAAAGRSVLVEKRTRLRASSGRVQLAAVGSAETRIPLDFANAEVGGLAGPVGQVSVREGSELVAGHANRALYQGSIVIRGGRFALESGSVMQAGGQVGSSGASIDIAVAEAAEISDLVTMIRALAPGPLASGGVRITGSSVTVEDGATVQSRTDSTAAGGDVVFVADSAAVSNGAQVGTLARGSGPGGDVVFDAGEIEVMGGQVQSLTTSNGRGGNLRIGERAGGEVAERITVVDGLVASEGSAFARGGDVSLSAQEIELRGGLTQVSSLHRVTTAPEEGVPPVVGGSILLDARGADSLVITDGALVSSENRSPQPGGSIEIRAGSFEITGGSASRSSTVQTITTAGPAGDISIEAGEMRVGPATGSDRAGVLASQVAPGATGAGGELTLDVESLVVDNGGQVSTTTLGQGASGAIGVAATGAVSLRGDGLVGGVPVPSGLFSRSETNANGGAVSVSARSIAVEDGAEISTVASTNGDSGGVALRAAEGIRVAGSGQQGSVVTARGVDGDGGDVALEADLVEVLAGGSIDVSTSGAGDGGLLSVTARELVVSGIGPNGIPSSLAAESSGAGDAGGIEAHVQTLRVEDGGEITAVSQGFGGGGGDIAILGAESVTVKSGGALTAESRNLKIAEGDRPGSVRIELAGDVVVASDGRLDARSFGSGDGGDVAVVARSLQVEDGRITAEAENGIGGDVDLRASQMQLANGAEVAVRSTGGDAGVVSIQAGTFQMTDSLITAQAKAFGGSVNVKASDLVYLLDSDINAVSEGGANVDGLAGGNIVIDPPSVVLNSSRLIADGRGNANGGNIQVTADAFLASTDSLLSASSELGLEGTVAIDAPESELSSEIASLPSDFLDPSALLREACLARDAPSGSFTMRGEGRLRAPPDAPLPADLGACAGTADCAAP